MTTNDVGLTQDDGKLDDVCAKPALFASSRRYGWTFRFLTISLS